MGLDISAYSKLKFVKCEDGDDCWPKHERLYPNPDFPAQADGLKEGCYERDADGGEIDFRAGSYSGYSAWRDSLAHFAGFPGVRSWTEETLKENAGKPFIELLYFSDCEGTIGPKTSAKLAADFAAHEKRAEKEMDTYEFDKYQDWKRAFEIAADGGAVCFH